MSMGLYIFFMEGQFDGDGVFVSLLTLGSLVQCGAVFVSLILILLVIVSPTDRKHSSRGRSQIPIDNSDNASQSRTDHSLLVIAVHLIQRTLESG